MLKFYHLSKLYEGDQFTDEYYLDMNTPQVQPFKGNYKEFYGN